MKATRFYHPANAAATSYGDGWRLFALAALGWLLGVQFKVEGMPYGSSRISRSFSSESGGINGLVGSASQSFYPETSE